MWAIAMLIILAAPVGALAQYVGDLSPHPYSSNGIGNPFSPGGPYSISPPPCQVAALPLRPVPIPGPMSPPNQLVQRSSIVPRCLVSPRLHQFHLSRLLAEVPMALPSQEIIPWRLEGAEAAVARLCEFMPGEL
ncbi:MAG: hypothetical protein OJF52_004242 [Nitrospira sp.]|jgi:hypothetical protein|nr:MAG: hypothetical protein OJF52_004242 [Nitrospira sp.]